jgi:phospholipid/cholesterol/gamma-HCH transport system permease protein
MALGLTQAIAFSNNRLRTDLAFDRLPPAPYFRPVQKGALGNIVELEAGLSWLAHPPESYLAWGGRKVITFFLTLRGLAAFALISLSVLLTKGRVARGVLRPLLVKHLARCGLGLLPMILFLALAVGLVVIGQTVSLLSQVGAQDLLGTVMVTVVVRELGPAITAAIVLARAGAANVIELGTSRALGEVEALEALGIDPIHYLVVPRTVGMALGVFALTVYLILGALLSGYLWAFVQDVPITPGEYFRQLAGALAGLDFIVLALKTALFGSVIAIVTCYHGLSQPLQLDDVAQATIRAVVHSVAGCVLVDAAFILLYLLV